MFRFDRCKYYVAFWIQKNRWNIFLKLFARKCICIICKVAHVYGDINNDEKYIIIFCNNEVFLLTDFKMHQMMIMKDFFYIDIYNLYNIYIRCIVSMESNH